MTMMSIACNFIQALLYFGQARPVGRCQHGFPALHFGAALRTGVDERQLTAIERKAHAAVARTPCDSDDIAIAAGRVLRVERRAEPLPG